MTLVSLVYFLHSKNYGYFYICIPVALLVYYVYLYTYLDAALQPGARFKGVGTRQAKTMVLFSSSLTTIVSCNKMESIPYSFDLVYSSVGAVWSLGGSNRARTTPQQRLK